MTQTLSATSDYIYHALERKYGIDDKTTQTIQHFIADFFHIGVNFNKVDSYRIDDSVRDGIKQDAEKVQYILNYFLNKVLKEKNIDISDCKIPNIGMLMHLMDGSPYL